MTIFKVVLALAALLLAAILGVAYKYRPIASDFNKTEQQQGKFSYVGLRRNASAELNLETIYSDASVFGGSSSGVVASIPDGMYITATVVHVRTAFGTIPLLIAASSIDGKTQYLKFSPEECVARMNSKTLDDIEVFTAWLCAACAIAWFSIKG